jgi:hypothetical protein
MSLEKGKGECEHELKVWSVDHKLKCAVTGVICDPGEGLGKLSRLHPRMAQVMTSSPAAASALTQRRRGRLAQETLRILALALSLVHFGSAR